MDLLSSSLRRPVIPSLEALSRRTVFRKKYGESFFARRTFTMSRTGREIESINEHFRHILGLE